MTDKYISTDKSTTLDEFLTKSKQKGVKSLIFRPIGGWKENSNPPEVENENISQVQTTERENND